MAKDYIEKRETGYYVVGSRIPLDTIVIAFLNGESAEGIVESFPALTLEHISRKARGNMSAYEKNREQKILPFTKGFAPFSKANEP